jgi:hypothetical protein
VRAASGVAHACARMPFGSSRPRCHGAAPSGEPRLRNRITKHRGIRP